MKKTLVGILDYHDVTCACGSLKGKDNMGKRCPKCKHCVYDVVTIEVVEDLE